MNMRDDARVSRVRRRFETWLRRRRVTTNLMWDDEKGCYQDLDEDWLWRAYFEGACPEFISPPLPMLLQSISKPLEVTP